MGKMSDEIRKQRLAEALGIEYVPPVADTPEVKEAKALASREAEAVLLYTENPKKFVEKMCLECHRPFAVNRTSIGYCSDACRKVALEARGLIWNVSADDPKERWSSGRAGPEPLTVPPVVLELLREPQADQVVTQTA